MSTLSAPSPDPPVAMPEPTQELINVTPDGHLQKTILVPGEGDMAGRGAKVSIKYTLRLATPAGGGKSDTPAAIIDTSDTRRNGMLSFTQGRRKVLTALDILVQGMRLGEMAVATAGPEYAFGRKGLPRKGVPPDAKIEISVELVEFSGGEQPKTVAEMSPRERLDQAKLCKEAGNTLFKEAKYEKAMIQYSQCIRYVANVFYKSADDIAKKSEDDIAKKSEDDRPKDQEVPAQNPAGAKEMKDESKEDDGFVEANVADENGDGDGDGGGDGAGDDDDDVIETLDVSTASATAVPEDADVAREPTQGVDTMSAAATENGAVPSIDEETNGHVEEDKNASEVVEEEEEEDDNPTDFEVKSLHVTALNNLSLCLVKMEQFKRAVESATLALQMDPDSSKAFYHRGRAQVALGEWDKALQDLREAESLQPRNMGIRTEIARLERKRRNFENLEKKQAAAMFA